ncbi:hypothetical protein [Roseateles asaccharophilus]|uniref:TspB protein n=1 Tax=Roseateles asaccharophilus TaxID=582607 RepID=A0ABU2AB96_9BURK|nr:hypothetical protein [Roseateles asaccharophilus]MDR7334280.1 hypothetical protein [Roseateles asaccharophilus]
MRKLLIALLAFSVIFFAVERVRAQALPSSPFSITASDALTLARQSWGSASLIVGGGTAVATTLATAAGGLFGITPIGWAGIGLVLLATVLMTSDASGNSIAVVVSTQDIDASPNPDLASGGQTTSGVSNYYALAPVTGGIVKYISSSSWSAVGSDILSEPALRLRAYIATMFAVPNSWLVNSITQVGNTYVASNGGDTTNIALGRCPSTSSGCVALIFTAPVGTTKAEFESVIPALPPFAAAAWTIRPSGGARPYFAIAVPLVLVNEIINCDPSTSYYEYSTASCILLKPTTTEPLSNGMCRVSWSTDGCPVFNRQDPDCASAAITLSCGSASVAPSVTVLDRATGQTVTTSRPAVASQGQPGSVTVKERTPNAANGTTVERLTTTQYQAAPAGQPKPAPVTNGANQSTLPGTGANTGSTPVAQVSVSNWPSVVNVQGTVTCTNCSTAQQPVNINVPDRFKIDGEVPADATGLPTPPEAAPPAGFITKLKERLAGFANIELPPHTATCPRLDISWHAWGVNLDLSNNTMCAFLEEHRTLFQGLMHFAYIATAIIIVLGA